MIEDDRQYALTLGEYSVLQRSPLGPVEREQIEKLSKMIADYNRKRGLGRGTN